MYVLYILDLAATFFHDSFYQYFHCFYYPLLLLYLSVYLFIHYLLFI